MVAERRKLTGEVAAVPRPNALNADEVSALVASAEGWVRKVAGQYAVKLEIDDQSALTYDDLVSVGRMGVWIAAQRYDASRGLKFLTYADYWAKALIRREIQAHYRAIRVPNSARKRALAGDDDPDLTLRLTRTGGLVRMDEILGESDQDHHETLGDDAPSALDDLLLTEEEAATRHLVTELPPLERRVLRARFWGRKTLAEVGRKIGCSREYVRQVEARALDRLRKRVGASE